MNLSFDFGTVRTTEFGVGLEAVDGETFSLVAVDGDVQNALQEMAEATWHRMLEIEDEPAEYQPSETYPATAHIYLPLADGLAERMRDLHHAENLVMDGTALSEPSALFCYFARFTDGEGRRLTALRRATQFKGILRSRLIRFSTDALKLVEDSVFKLDTDFDLLVDASQLHILRPSGFEFVCRLQRAVLEAAPENVRVLQRDLSFVDFASIQAYAGKHPRAARYLASIRAQREARNINKTALKRLCKNTGVVIRESAGKILVDPSDVMGFLEVLDRRRYEIDLVSGSPERFRAGSRQKLVG